MGKFLLILIIAVLAYWIIKTLKRKRTEPRAGKSEDMVRCAQCGVHLPRSESVMTGQLFYCSAEHRRLHQHTG